VRAGVHHRDIGYGIHTHSEQPRQTQAAHLDRACRRNDHGNTDVDQPDGLAQRPAGVGHRCGDHGCRNAFGVFDRGGDCSAGGRRDG